MRQIDPKTVEQRAPNDPHLHLIKAGDHCLSFDMERGLAEQDSVQQSLIATSSIHLVNMRTLRVARRLVDAGKTLACK